MKPRLAELCAGYGGLHLALIAAGRRNVDLAWYAESDPDAARVMARHHPDVPNLGDITAADWSSAEPVDILAAGFPCQDISNAGRRAGIDGQRSGVWRHVASAISVVRPRLVLLENVAALLVRGGVRVIGDLAALGYVGCWMALRASDIGAPHQRNRVFILAHPADADRDTLWRLPGDRRQVPRGGQMRGGLMPTPGARLGTPGPGLAEDRYRSGRRNLDDAVALLPTPTVRDADRGRWDGYRNGRPLSETIALLPTPRATDGEKGGPNQRGSSGDLMLPAAVQPERWGAYAAAIRRWEHVTGRSAPEPTAPGARGAPRLSARFVEWLMGLPDGHVTDVLPRNAALRVLGNGVVPQQGALAIRALSAVTS